MLIISWEYLLGKAFAGTWNDRGKPEWPPHPDRVFQALVAAWGENGRDGKYKSALEWLEKQGSPAMSVPQSGKCTPHMAFVPVNDDVPVKELLPPGTNPYVEYVKDKKAGELKPELLTRHIAGRTFPATTVSSPVSLIWENAKPMAEVLAFLRQLCAMVTHVGCATSAVRMWVADALDEAPNLLPDPQGDIALRIPTPGRLTTLEDAYADGGENWRRPPCAKWANYSRKVAAPLPRTVFDPSITVLKAVGGDRFLLSQAPAVTEALRATLIKGADGDANTMRLISGHAADGSPLNSSHLAVIPLGFVAHEHADGHLLGMALVLPRECGYLEHDGCLRALIKMGNPDNGCLCLNLGKAGTMLLDIDEREFRDRPATLRPDTWTCHACRWASVTPIACDRLPPRRTKEYDAWAAEQITIACARIGLPVPIAVEIRGVSAFRGAPACKPYPPLLSRDGHTPRWHVHAAITFADPVCGPVVLGAGRYRGYGLCRPLADNQE